MTDTTQAARAAGCMRAFLAAKPAVNGVIDPDIEADLRTVLDDRDRLLTALREPCDGSRCEDYGAAHCHRCADAENDKLIAERDRLQRELAAWHERESADAAAGSYAQRAEKAEADRDRLAVELKQLRRGPRCGSTSPGLLRGSTLGPCVFDAGHLGMHEDALRQAWTSPHYRKPNIAAVLGMSAGPGDAPQAAVDAPPDPGVGIASHSDSADAQRGADGLRARVAEALNTAAAAYIRDDPERASKWIDREWRRHDQHHFDGGCALCRGEADTLADAIMVVLGSDRIESLTYPAGENEGS